MAVSKVTLCSESIQRECYSDTFKNIFNDKCFTLYDYYMNIFNCTHDFLLPKIKILESLYNPT